MNVNSLLILTLLLLTSVNHARGSSSLQVQHQEPTFVERGTPFQLDFQVSGINSNEVEEAYVFYQLDGEMNFQQEKAQLQNSTFTARLEIEDEQASQLKYYFKVYLNNGEELVYPQNHTSDESVNVEIVDQRTDPSQQLAQELGIDYTILSPDPNTSVINNEAVIALTLFFDSSKVDTTTTEFELLLDGRDITDEAYANEYFFTYAPDSLAEGDHAVMFNVKKPDTTYTLASWEFTAFSARENENAGGGPSPESHEKKSWFPSDGQLELSARNQQFGGYEQNILNGNLAFSGSHGNITYSAHGLLTSEESSNLQSQNRLSGNVQVGEWLELKGGHIYPTLSSLTIAGQRMQGIYAGFHGWNKAVNIEFLHGNLKRGITSQYGLIEAEHHTFNGSSIDTTYSLPLEDEENGTFERKLTGGRLGLGRGENFKLGLNLLKVEDDTGSISVIDNFHTLMELQPKLADNLTPEERQNLSENPHELEVQNNPNPQGNFVAGSDLDMSFDNNRIRIKADGAVSLLNRDISNGVLNQEAAEEMGFIINEETEDLLSRLSWLIIINENMNTLPLRFDNSSEITSGELFFPTSIVASKSEVGLHYLNNNLRVRYRWIGPNFHSLASSTVRKDIMGFSISDRLKMFNDRLFITLGYESLNDNVIGHKDATTVTSSYKANLSWYPINEQLPRISFGVMNRNRDNGISQYNPWLEQNPDIAGSAVQNYITDSGETVSAPNPRLSETYQLNGSLTQQFKVWNSSHEATVNYNRLSTVDQWFDFGDSQSDNLSLHVTSRLEHLPLQTNFGFNVNNTSGESGLNDITIVGGTFGGSFFLLNNKLNLNTDLTFTKNRSESTPLQVHSNNTPQQSRDDYYHPNESARSYSESHSFIFNTSGQYNFMNRHALRLTVRLSNIQNAVSAIPIPNDHYLQARYIFSF